MRRMIHNTTAIAACFTLLLPQLAEAQLRSPAPAALDSAGGAGDDTAPMILAEAETEELPLRRGKDEDPDKKARNEGKAEKAKKQDKDEERRAAKDRSEKNAERKAEKRPEGAGKPAAKDPKPAAKDPEPRDRENRDTARDEPGQKLQNQQRAQAQDAEKQRAKAVEKLAKQEAKEAKRDRKEAARRAAEDEREQAAQRREQSDTKQQAERQRRQAEARRREANEKDEQAQSPDGADRLQAAAASRADEARQREQREDREPARRDNQPRADRDDGARSEAARQAARETRAARAAALNEAEQGKVVEQRITRENSRSSDEDFATSLREAVQPRSEQRADKDDNDDNDLAKALLLGLGAVAVGTYLNNNRQVALSAPDRIVVTQPDGSQELIKDDTALLRQPGSNVTTENFDDGSSRTVVTRPDGSRVVTIRDADLRVLRRTLVSPDGHQTRLIDDTAEVEPVDVATLPAPAPLYPTDIYQDETALRDALRQEVDVDRRFTLGQIRNIPEVRALVPPVAIDAITFETGSAAISPNQAQQLATLGKAIQDAIAENPREVFLIEGHTDMVGPDAANLALSDRRAESVALALSEYFQVPPENLVVQGYGEQFPQVRQQGDVRENRRAAVRRITDLLQTAEVQ